MTFCCTLIGTKNIKITSQFRLKSTSSDHDNQKYALIHTSYCRYELVNLQVQHLSCSDFRVSVCKRELFHTFLQLVNSLPIDQRPPTLSNTNLTTYEDHKKAAASYQETWHTLQQCFSSWCCTPRHYNAFMVEKLVPCSRGTSGLGTDE